MIRVRLHGRGGQGMKTASRIVGTAATLDGFEAQDSPIYGAERRGAPMVAYVRIARERILERGLIASPDLVVVADDTLLDEAAARPLAGLPPRGVLLIATPHPAEAVHRHTGHPGPVVARDWLSLALEETGTPASLSTALAAAASALLGLSVPASDEAIRTELAAIGLRPEAIEASLGLAARARAGVAPAALPVPAAGTDAGSPVVDVAYAPPPAGVPSVIGPPNTPLRRTGSWRVFRPVIELAACTRCWICFVRCPEGAIALDDEDWPRVDYEVCKGCLICVEECPTDAIGKERERREWAEAVP